MKLIPMLLCAVLLGGCALLKGKSTVAAASATLSAAANPAGALLGAAASATKPKPEDNFGKIQRMVYNERENRDDDADFEDAYPTIEAQRCRIYELLVAQGRVLQVPSDEAHFCAGKS